MNKEEENPICTLCGKEEVKYSLEVDHDGDELFWVGCCVKCRQTNEEKDKHVIDYFFSKGMSKTKKDKEKLLEYIRDKCLYDGKYISRKKLLEIKKHIKEKPIDVILDTESTRSLMREMNDKSWDAEYRRAQRRSTVRDPNR